MLSHVNRVMTDEAFSRCIIGASIDELTRAGIAECIAAGECHRRKKCVGTQWTSSTFCHLNIIDMTQSSEKLLELEGICKLAKAVYPEDCISDITKNTRFLANFIEFSIKYTQ